MKSIYTIYIPVKDQEQANRLKAICLEYGLPIFYDFLFIPKGDNRKYKYFYFYEGDFCNWLELPNDIDLTESTEEEFINLLKEIKK